MKCIAADLIGERFSRLVVISRHGSSPEGHSTWVCRCDCGAEITPMATALKSGRTKSCGCLLKETSGRRFRKHGKSETRTWAIWKGMISRCSCRANSSWRNYGGRGIKVCEEWLSFEGFLIDMGESPAGMSIERIDVNGNYELKNCKWATAKEQQNNKRNNHYLTAFGKTQTLSEWCEELGIAKSTAGIRISKGWTDEKVLSTGDFRFNTMKHAGANRAA